MYPPFLQPHSTHQFPVNGKEISVPKCAVQFQPWNGPPVKETFGGKPIVAFDGKPMFAELAVMKHFVKAGWQARWIETYGRTKRPLHLSAWKDDKYSTQTHDAITDERIVSILDGIRKQNSNSFTGCWDVLAWKDEQIIFAELKRVKKDRIRGTQLNWLQAALQSGLTTENFLVVEWDW